MEWRILWNTTLFYQRTNNKFDDSHQTPAVHIATCSMVVIHRRSDVHRCWSSIYHRIYIKIVHSIVSFIFIHILLYHFRWHHFVSYQFISHRSISSDIKAKNSWHQCQFTSPGIPTVKNPNYVSLESTDQQPTFHCSQLVGKIMQNPNVFVCVCVWLNPNSKPIFSTNPQ